MPVVMPVLMPVVMAVARTPGPPYRDPGRNGDPAR
jgi:hypothetical protein